MSRTVVFTAPDGSTLGFDSEALASFSTPRTTGGAPQIVLTFTPGSEPVWEQENLT